MVWTLPRTAITLRAPVRASVLVPAFDSRAEHMPETAAMDGGLAARAVLLVPRKLYKQNRCIKLEAGKMTCG